MKKIALFFVLLLAICGGITLYRDAHKAGQQKLHFHRSVASDLCKNWIDFHPKGEDFSALFPKKPEEKTRQLPIPGGDNFLPYKEFTCSTLENVHFSVSYTALPDSWLKYSTGLVLGGALKVLMEELGKTELVGKEITKFKGFPALDYEHYTVAESDQREWAGTLVLVGNTLYKVEMAYPLKLHSQLQDELASFIENFCPAKVTPSQIEHSALDRDQSPQ